jgi:phage baseplate assembly protein W
MIVKQIKTKFTDLDLNFTRHPATNDVSKISDARAIGRAIRNLVFTKKYESPFHPEIYCQVYDMLFEPMSPEVTVSIQKSIEYCISNFEPRAELVAVDVIPDYSSKSYDITIAFRIVGYMDLYQISFSLERTI